jgi:hypothetical protein
MAGQEIDSQGGRSLNSTPTLPKTAADLRAEEAFKQASGKMKDAISRASRKSLETLPFPSFEESSSSISSQALALGKFLDGFIELRDSYKQSPALCTRSKALVQRWFRASYPFAKIFLGLAKDASSSVHPSRISQANT